MNAILNCSQCGSAWMVNDSVEDAVITEEQGVVIAQTQCNVCGAQLAEVVDNRKISAEKH